MAGRNRDRKTKKAVQETPGDPDLQAQLKIAERVSLEIAAVSLTRRWGELLFLQLAVIGGAFAVYYGMPTMLQTPVSGHWQVVLIASATMCIGFGAATLLYGRPGFRHAEQLEQDYRVLVSRADSLLKSSSLRRDQKESESARAR
jgi:hypothetical protein